MARTFLPLVICEVQQAGFSEQKAHTYDKGISHSLTTPEGQLGYCAALILNKTGYICGRLTFPIMCSILS